MLFFLGQGIAAESSVALDTFPTKKLNDMAALQRHVCGYVQACVCVILSQCCGLPVSSKPCADKANVLKFQTIVQQKLGT